MKKKREKNLQPAEIEERIQDYWKSLQGCDRTKQSPSPRKLLYGKKAGAKV